MYRRLKRPLLRRLLKTSRIPDFSIFLVKSPEEVEEHTLGELLPLCFTL